MTDSPPGRQAQLREFDHVDEPPQCAAIAESTGERCQRDAMGAIPYCGDHKHLLDVEVDLKPNGSEPVEIDRLSENRRTDMGRVGLSVSKANARRD